MSSKPIFETSEIVFSGFFKIGKETFSLNGERFDYYSVLPPADAVSILAKDDDGRLLVLKEYRYPVKKGLLGLPGGYMDPHEIPEITAKRELLEETGFEADMIKPLGSAYPYPGMSGQRIFYFLAENIKKIGPPKKDPHEVIEIVFYDEKELRKKIIKEPVDGVLLSGLYLIQMENN